MNISVRIFVVFFLLLGLVAYALLTTVFDELKPGFSRATEETLVDTANLLAEVLEDDMVAHGEPSTGFAHAMNDYAERRFDARIYELRKSEPGLRVYVTDARGRVVFDSAGRDLGADYSRWNDVLRTLRGEYGARATREDPADEFSTVYYVAAPIRHAGELVGVVSVGKPSRALLPYLEASETRIRIAAILLVLGGILVAALFATWISRSLRRLSNYADAVSRGEPARLPELREPEFVALGKAMARMREELEGKEYVENTVHALTHELKSPLAAIRGAIELLAESPQATDRERFIDNIRSETDRMQRIAERMLQLASVERLQDLAHIDTIDLRALLQEITEHRNAQASGNRISFEMAAAGEALVRGDEFLLEQAVGNLLDNAIDFSPIDDPVRISLQADLSSVKIAIIDQGDGIPEYAIRRIFERFYSLPRPQTGRRSTGLGLSFVREVARLHGGDIMLTNRPDGGACAMLRIPRTPARQ